MSIVAMKKLRLIGVRSQQKDILKDLMLLGCVEITNPDMNNPDFQSLNHDTLESADLILHKSERTKIINSLKKLDKYSPSKGGLLTPLPEIELDKLLDESSISSSLKIADEILDLDEQIRKSVSEENKIRVNLETLAPWKDFDYPLNIRETDTCSVIYGALPATADISVITDALASEVDEAELFEVSQDDNSKYLILVVVKEKYDEAISVLKLYGWSNAALDNFSGSASSAIDDCNNKLDACISNKESLVETITSLGDKRDDLQLCADILDTKIAQEENASKLMDTESAFVFSGWVTAPDVDKLESVLNKYDCAYEIEDPDPEHPEEVPVKLKNNKLTKPFNMVTEMYSLPAYNGLDPNPFIAPFFALFFGIMFADMAYGLILLAAGLIFTYKAKPRGTMKNMAGLLIECGITTTIIGFLTGGFFGDVVSQIGSWFGQEWSIVPHLGTINVAGVAIDLPLDLLSGNNPLYVLILAICLGAIHLFVGVLLGMYLKIRDGQWVDAILNDFCWWVILAGLGLMLLKKGTIVLWIGVGMMILGQLITGKGLGKLTGIVGAVYNGATGYLGDFLSYSRLMALMLAGSVIASVFNQLGGLGNKNGITVGGTILFIFVFCIGHALNFGLNLIGCFVHTLRLQFLEFFGKWYRDGGRRFNPLSIRTKYNVVKEEKN